MKKNVLKVMTMACVLSLSLAFTACGSKDSGADAGQDANAGAAQQEQNVDDSGADVAAPGADADGADVAQPDDNGSGQTPLEEMLADPAAQAQLEEAMSSQDGMTVEVKVENGNILVYRFILDENPLEGTDLSEEDFTSSMEDGIDAVASTFESLADSLRSELGMSDMVMRIEYCYPDGSEIVSRDF